MAKVIDHFLCGIPVEIDQNLSFNVIQMSPETLEWLQDQALRDPVELTSHD